MSTNTKVMRDDESIVGSCPCCGENLFDAKLLVIDEMACPYCGGGTFITLKMVHLVFVKSVHRK